MGIDKFGTRSSSSSIEAYPDGLDMVAVTLPLRLRDAAAGVWFVDCDFSDGLLF